METMKIDGITEEFAVGGDEFNGNGNENGNTAENGNENGNSSPNKRNLSPSNEENRDRARSRSRSYEDRRRSGGGGARSRSPRRKRGGDRDRGGNRRSDNGGRSDINKMKQADRELGLKYRWEKTIYVSNIPYEVRWPDLKDLFKAKCGEIMFCEVFEKDGKSLGVGSIEFKTVEDAEKAVEIMHQTEIDGRKISVRMDGEGYKTRMAKEMTMDHHRSRGGMNGNDSQANALAMALNQASSLLGGMNSQSNGSNGLLSLLGGLGGGSVMASNSIPMNSNLLSSLGGTNPNLAQTALLNQLAAQMKVDGPVTNRLFVASLDYKVDEAKLKEVYELSGKVQNVSLFRDRDGKSRGMAVVEYETPLEALNAVSMFNNQTLLDRQMTVRFDTKPPRDDEVTPQKLPSGLRGIGSSLLNANQLASAASSLPSLGALSALTGSQSGDLNALLGLNLNGSGLNNLMGLNTSNGTNSLMSLSTNGSGMRGGMSSNNISKVFVKNIPFSWDDRKLKEKFRQAGYIEYAEIKTRDGKSRGCGLIRFSSPDQAVKAVELFNGSRFEGRTLEVKLDQMP